DQDLGRVEAQALLGPVRAVHAVGVVLARAGAGQVAVPVERRPLGDGDAFLLVTLVSEEAELNCLRVLGEEREVDALPVPAGARRERASGPAPPPRSSAPLSGPSASMPSASRADCASTTTWVPVTGTADSWSEKLQTISYGPRTTRSQRAP